jgi:hypothetical protein
MLTLLARLARWLRRLVRGKPLPQGVTRIQFAWIAAKLSDPARAVGGEACVHGSRAAEVGRPDSDLDIAILVDAKRFEQLVGLRFGTPTLGSAKDRTRKHAEQTGKIQAGEAGLRALRKELENYLEIAVVMSIIRRGGPFDRGPYMPLSQPS